MMRLDGRRLVRALVLGALVLLLMGGGTGFATASGDEGEPPVMAFPRPGASATYGIEEFHVGDREVEGYLSGRVLTLTWMPQEWVVDQDYNLRLVHPLSSDYSYPRVDGTTGVQTRESYYDAATGEAVITSGEGRFYSAVDGLDCGGSDECSFRYDTYGGRGGACAMRNDLQQGQGLHKPLRITGFCDYLDGEEELTYFFVNRTRVGSEDAYLFEDAQQPRFKAWFSPRHAFPVRFTSTLSDEVDQAWLGHERMYDLRMQASTEGTGEYTRPVASLIVPGPGVPQMRPTGAGGDLFDFDGFPKDLTFPEAYRAAAADESDAGLAGFLSQHPDAYVVESYGQMFKDDHGVIHDGWSFIVSDGSAWKAVAVQRGPPGVQMLGLAYWVPPVVGEAGYTTDVLAWDLDDEQSAMRDGGSFYPPRSLAPSELPRPADLLDRYQFIEDREVPDARYFGWSFKCENPACLSAKTWLGAGYQIQARASGGLPLDGGYGGDRAILSTKADGTPIMRYAFSYDRPGYQGLLGDGQDQSSADFRLAPQSIRRDVAGTWQLPAPAAVAGLSFLALVASALYYFWPAIKGAAGLGLFSRIEDGKVLEHPTRRRIHDAIASEPGIHFQALSRKADIGRGALEHHLRKLVAADVVTVRRAPGFTCYFLKGTMDRHMLDAAPALRTEGSRAVLQAVAANPGASSRDLAAALGISPSTASYHLKRLETAGLVAPGEKSGVRVTPLGSQAAA